VHEQSPRLRANLLASAAPSEPISAGSHWRVLQETGSPEVAEIAVLRALGPGRDERHVVEVVDGLTPPLARREKWIINVSTQFGCPVGCPFCDAADTFHGNLSEDELLAQVAWALARHPGDAASCEKLKVHFARMGEPALNDAVPGAMARLGELEGVGPDTGLWACAATVAPRGREAWFERLLEVKEQHFRGRFQLQFSLQSTDASARERLIPVAHWSLDEIAAYGARFFRDGDRRVVLNLALAEDVPFDAQVLVDTFSPETFAVKLTPVNPTAAAETHGFRTVLRSEQDLAARAVAERLTARGYDVIWSVGDAREDEIGSNCGQAVRVQRGAGPLR
jgi:23S rRNA (adenine2503-C2)-methyltransferase